MSARARSVSAKQAAAELVRREQARRSLLAFSQFVAPWYRPAHHHRYVAEKLEQVARFVETRGAAGIGRLMVFEPPRHGKTEQISRLFPAWLLGKLPESRVILTSYGADLAADDSRAVRTYLTSDAYRALFGGLSAVDAPVELSDDSRAKTNWDLAPPHRGGVVSAGIGGGITGKGAHLLIIDDPFKNRDEADSEAYRRRVMSWYRSSAYQRLEDGGAIVITHTRWHPDDLAGEMLQAMASDPLLADQWEVVFLPALALAEHEYSRDEAAFQENLLRGLYLPTADPLGRKPGQALYPEKYDERALARIAANVGDFEFASLHQQLPRPSSGGFFNESDFKKDEKAPEGLQWYRYIDLALGETKQADWNATVGTALDERTGDVYYRDMLKVHDLNDFFVQLVEWMISPREQGTIWGVESVAFSSLVFRELMRDRRLANVAIRPVVPAGDKVSRARAIQTRSRQGLVHLVIGAWNKECLREIVAFPKGKHDDQVDTMSGGLQMIAEDTQGSGKTETAAAQVVEVGQLIAQH